MSLCMRRLSVYKNFEAKYDSFHPILNLMFEFRLR